MTTPLTTGADVAAWLGLPVNEDSTEKYEGVAEAADKSIRAYVTVPTVLTVEVIPADLALAAAMYASRLARRSESPTGMTTLGGDQAFYVSRYDQDITDLLAPYKKFGFA